MQILYSTRIIQVTEYGYWYPGMITQTLTPKRSYQLRNSFGNLINRNNMLLLLRDNASKELKYNIDLDLVLDQVATTPDTDDIPIRPTP